MDRHFKFEVGEVVKDIVTGHEGVIMGVTYYFTGCNHYGICSQKITDKTKPDLWQWFDEKRLVSVNKKKISFFAGKEPTSGPMQSPPQM
jgi:hypothetical protein